MRHNIDSQKKHASSLNILHEHCSCAYNSEMNIFREELILTQRLILSQKRGRGIKSNLATCYRCLLRWEDSTHNVWRYHHRSSLRHTWAACRGPIVTSYRCEIWPYQSHASSCTSRTTSKNCHVALPVCWGCNNWASRGSKSWHCLVVNFPQIPIYRRQRAQLVPLS